MRIKTVLICVALVGAVGCKKKGGGGGGWLVGEEGLMVNVDDGGRLGEGYDLGASETLHAIACRYVDEAWVAGAAGTLLYTADAGASWEHHDVGTTADLRAVATQDSGPVFVAGDGVFLAANPAWQTGAAAWQQLGDGTTSFRAVAAAQRGATVLAVSADGGIWAYADGALVRRATVAGARGIAVSPDGQSAIAVGDGVMRSADGGVTWTAVAAADGRVLEDVRIDDDGTAVAVGAAGVVARIDADGRVLTQQLGDRDLRALHLPPTISYDHVGYAAGDGGQIWLTTDAGWTWTAGPTVGKTVLGVDQIGFGHN